MSVLRTQKNIHGFTLIEMMVALSLFTIVVTIAVGAFLSLIGSSKGIQSEQSVMTTLTFVLDSMTREIRTGANYYCGTKNYLESNNLSTTTRNNCTNGNQGISFVESGISITKNNTSRRIAYFYDSSTESILRRVGTSVTAESIVSQGIKVTNAQFFVTGTERLGDSDTEMVQPTVTIVLEAQDETGAVTTLQTTITQRELDI